MSNTFRANSAMSKLDRALTKNARHADAMFRRKRQTPINDENAHRSSLTMVTY